MINITSVILTPITNLKQHSFIIVKHLSRQLGICSISPSSSGGGGTILPVERSIFYAQTQTRGNGVVDAAAQPISAPMSSHEASVLSPLPKRPFPDTLLVHPIQLDVGIPVGKNGAPTPAVSKSERRLIGVEVACGHVFAIRTPGIE